MSMLNWAEKEIELACEKERKNGEKEEWDYGCACYESALKAYKSLTEDGHSGFSIMITKDILNRLIDGKPLTPIIDTDDIWNEVGGYEDECKHYQCTRMSSLFKKVYDDGTTQYSDTERIRCINVVNNIGYYSGFVAEIINEMYPIQMPYCPKEPIKVFCAEWLTDRQNGDFDTIGILYIQHPNEKSVSVKRFFKESESGWEEISIHEYKKRVDMHFKRERKELEDDND